MSVEIINLGLDDTIDYWAHVEVPDGLIIEILREN